MQIEYKKNHFILQKLNRQHFEQLSLLFEDQKMTEMTQIELPGEPSQRQLVFELWLNNPLIYVILQNNDLIGMIGFYPWYDKEGTISAHAVEIGYCLREVNWGQHIMPEALQVLIEELFKTTQVSEIYAEIEKNNQQSLRVLEKLVFNPLQQEGRERLFKLKK